MTGHRFQDIWKEQCEAARGVREQHGTVSALDYIVGEKLTNYAETAATRPEFARELPRFVAEVRAMFSPEELRVYLEHLERMQAQEDAADEPLDDDDVDLSFDTPERRVADKARLVWLKELLTMTTLGTG